MIPPKSRRPRSARVAVESMESRLVLHGSGGTTTYITSTYEAILDRAPTSAEVASWTKAFQGGTSDATFATALDRTGEHRTLEVEHVFSALGETASAATISPYVAELEHGETMEQVERSVLDSSQTQKAHASNASFVQGLVQVAAAHATDRAVLISHDLDLLAHGMSRDAVAKSTLASSDHFGEVADDEFEGVLGHGEGEAEHELEIGELKSGKLSDDGLLVNLCTSSENEMEHGGEGGGGKGGDG